MASSVAMAHGGMAQGARMGKDMAASRLSLSGLRLESSTRERNQDLHGGCRLQGVSVPRAWQWQAQ